MRKFLSVLAVLLSMATLLHTQESRATLIGRVTDPTGAIVGGAVVRATNLATNSAVSTTSNESGSY